ncbi:MAG: hypothetical protein M3439_12580 [Chloroflexota bacterium]|nr:hypothetical protein [Chloroflexota bacterium]
MSDEKNPQPNASIDSGSTGDDQFIAERVHAGEPAHTTAPQPSEQASPTGGSSTAGSLAGKIRQTIYKRPGSREQVPATEATAANLSAVTATTVLMNQSGSEGITADRVTMERSGSRSIDAKSVQMDRSGAVALSADNAVLLKSSAVQVVAEEARLSHSSAIFLSSGRASIEHSRIAIFSGSADGDIQPLITGRTAAILIGALAAFLFAIIALPFVRTRD